MEEFKARLQELKELKDGWYDGEGKAPDRHKLDKFAKTFEMIYPLDFPLPYVYPTPDGGIQLEWDLENDTVELELNLDSLEGELLCVDRDGQSDLSRVDLSTKDGWDKLLGIIDYLHTGKEPTDERRTALLIKDALNRALLALKEQPKCGPAGWTVKQAHLRRSANRAIRRALNMLEREAKEVEQ